MHLHPHGAVSEAIDVLSDVQYEFILSDKETDPEVHHKTRNY